MSIQQLSALLLAVSNIIMYQVRVKAYYWLLIYQPKTVVLFTEIKISLALKIYDKQM